MAEVAHSRLRICIESYRDSIKGCRDRGPWDSADLLRLSWIGEAFSCGRLAAEAHRLNFVAFDTSLPDIAISVS